MHRILITTIGVVLVSGAVSAFAGQAERDQLTACRAAIAEHFGDGTYTHLRRVRRGISKTELRILARAASRAVALLKRSRASCGGNAVVVCTARHDGALLLRDRDGLALRPVHGGGAQEQVTMAE